MESKKLALCVLDENDKILTKRVLTVSWDNHILKEAIAKFNVNVTKEMASVIRYQIINEVKLDNVIEELIRESSNNG